MKNPTLSTLGLVAVILSSLIPLPLLSWNEADHQLMTRLALQEVAKEWRLDEPCEIRPLQSLLDKLGQLRPELGDFWHWADYLQINPKTDFEYLPPDLQGKKGLTPLDILSYFSVDPDDGRDQDLFVRDEKGNPRYAYPDQKWFGAMRGGDSQAFRHIEKPPFHWRHPLGTFGFPFRAIGEATRRAEIYTQVSLLAFSHGEDYWGWRLLASALHYLEDLHNPYHAGQITPGLLVRGIWAYLTWGWREKGFLGTFSHIVSNSHRFYESLVALPGRADNGLKKEALQALKGSDTLTVPGTVQEFARQVRDGSNRLFPKLVGAVTAVSDPVLFSSYDFKSDIPSADDPTRFLKKGPEAEKSLREIFMVTRDRFASAGRVIRTAVHDITPAQR